jgi:hypothetical protein
MTILIFVISAQSFAAVLYPTQGIVWNRTRLGSRVMSMVVDSGGNLWAGTEDEGVAEYVRLKSTWVQYTDKTGLGDNCGYALACDRLGRVWVGSLRHGVSVYNGKSWRTYTPGRGSIGGRVFAIATSPLDGDVWIATSSGIARYSLRDDVWKYYTKKNGLSSNSVDSIAFDQSGNAYVGTLAHGVCIGSYASGYQNWKVVRVDSDLPQKPFGNGFPSDTINDVCVAGSGTIYVGTDHGLGWSENSGASWHFLHGEDWRSFLEHTQTDPGAKDGELLSEDFVTKVREDSYGRIWVGHLRTGVDCILPDTKHVLRLGRKSKAPDYIASLLPADWTGGMLVGAYGGGLQYVRAPDTVDPPLNPPEQVYKTTIGAAMPLPPVSPKLDELTTMLGELNAVPALDPASSNPFAVALDQDWNTEGDWLGRYGRYWAGLCAITPYQYTAGSGWQGIATNIRTGGSDGPRWYIHWVYTDNQRSLELPPLYLESRFQQQLTTEPKIRREGEVNDNAEALPPYTNGPNLFYSVSIPEGVFRLSIYNFNKDGADGGNRWRDYGVSVRFKPAGDGLSNIDHFFDSPEAARARVFQYLGGVWTPFLVKGPGIATIELSRGCSTNVELTAVMLDLPDEEPAPFFVTKEDWEKRQAALDKSAADEFAAQTARGGKPISWSKPTNTVAAADAVFKRLTLLKTTNPIWWAENKSQYYAALFTFYSSIRQSAASAAPSKELLRRIGTCCYELASYPEWEKIQVKRGLKTARSIEKSLVVNENSSESDEQWMQFQLLTGHLKSKASHAPASKKK